jgi:probable F420-dependent oxidoreductase
MFLTPWIDLYEKVSRSNLTAQFTSFWSQIVKAETLLPLGKLDPGLKAPEVELDLGAVADDARQVESLGYHALLMEETKDDPFQVLALAAAATDRVRLGTSVAIAFARSPFVVAQSAWTLQKLSQGRFELGLGSQVRGHIRRRYGMEWHPPGPWMRDYVRAVRALWHSWQTRTSLAFESTRYNLNLTVPLFTPEPIEHPAIPVLVAAVNPYMCRVAAEVGDGVRLHPVCTPAYIKNTLIPAMEPYRSEDFSVCLKPLIATARDQQTLAERVEITRQRLAFYCSTPAYANAFAAYGLQDLCAEMAQLSKQQRWDEMSARIDDELLHRFVVVSLFEDLAKTIAQRYGDCIDRIEISFPLKDESDARTLRCIIDELAALG